MKWSGRTLRRAGWAGLVAAVLLVGYLAGAFSATFKTFPFPQLMERPLWALQAYHRQSRILDSIYDTSMWVPAEDEAAGVVRHREARSHDGYTLYTAGNLSGAYLVDMDGHVVHRWELPLKEAWSNPPHLDDIPPEPYIHWRRVHLFPNGDLLAIYESIALTPAGCGLVKIDKNSNVVWRYADRVHHDVALADDGSIYTLVHQPRLTSARPVDGISQLPPVVGDEYLVELSADGREQRRLNLLDMLAESDYRALLQMYGPRTDSPARTPEPTDVLHANAVEIVDRQFANAHAFAERGQVLVSVRNFDALLLVDVEREEIVWATRGFWRQQHDPDIVEGGRLMVFDNQGSSGAAGESRILQFDPTSRQVDWMYRGTDAAPFDSDILGSQQPLPNENLLITSSNQGRLFEITPDGEIVWEYRNETLRPDGRELQRPVILSGLRYSASELSFEFAKPSSGNGASEP